MAQTAQLPVLSGESGLARYMQDIRKFPVLEANQEYMLAKRWQEHADLQAAQQLVTSHLRLVAKVASGYRGYGLPLSELISEGNIGMMQAVKKFEPDRGFRLATYAIWWIRASIQEYILHSWSLVKIGTTAAQKKLFFNLRKVKNKLQLMEDGDMAPDNVAEIAKQLQVSNQEVIDMNRRLSHGDFSLNATVKDDGEGLPFENPEDAFGSFRSGLATGGDPMTGSGIGLTISRQLAELHRGTLEVESEAGVGTKFTLLLPVERAAARKLVLPEAN